MNVQLFQPNNHSSWKINYRPVDASTDQLVRTVMEDHYRTWLDDVKKVEQVDEAEVNSNNFKITGTKEGASVCYLLRRYRETRDQIATVRVYEVLKHLRAGDVRVPEILSSHQGVDTVTTQGYTFTLFRFLEADHFRGNLDELADTALELGRLDLMLSSYPDHPGLREQFAFPSGLSKLREFSMNIWNALFEAVRQHKHSLEHHEFDDRVLAQQEFIEQSLERARVGAHSRLSDQLVHFDLHPHNLLTDGKRLLTFLDFDSLRILPRIHGLAFTVHRLMRQCVVSNQPANTKEFIAQAKQLFLDQYQKHNVISPEELPLIPHFIRSEALARLSIVVKLFYYEGNSQWIGDFEKHLATLQEAEYFE